MNTEDITLLTVIMNLVIQPIFQYLMHSRCTRVKMGCIECDRKILEPKGEQTSERRENEEV